MHEKLRDDPFIVGDQKLARPKVGRAAEDLLRAFYAIKEKHGLSETEVIAALAVMVGSWQHGDNRAFFTEAMQVVEADARGRVRS
jgi:hypothetical protein